MYSTPPPAHAEETWRSPTGEVRISSPAPGVMLYRLSGYIHEDSVAVFLRAAERFTRDGQRTVSFVDAERVVGYDSAVRTRVTDARRPRAGEVHTHVLVRSRLVSMGISVGARVAGSNVVSYADRARFEDALAKALAAARRSDED